MPGKTDQKMPRCGSESPACWFALGLDTLLCLCCEVSESPWRLGLEAIA